MVRRFGCTSESFFIPSLSTLPSATLSLLLLFLVRQPFFKSPVLFICGNGRALRDIMIATTIEAFERRWWWFLCRCILLPSVVISFAVARTLVVPVAAVLVISLPVPSAFWLSPGLLVFLLSRCSQSQLVRLAERFRHLPQQLMKMLDLSACSPALPRRLL